MNIRSLLIGSAAAMVAVSGAQAADAVVVEPEPVEYVRVCDAYGAGFFFIPGTETCLRFSGYVRTQFTSLSVDNTSRAGIEDYNNTRWTTRTRLDVDARNETDWGTLRSLIRLQSNNAVDDGGNSAFEVDQALITIAGLRAGIGGSLFNANFAAGMNLEGVPQIFEDGLYGFTNSHVIDYTIAIDGLTIAVGAEDARSSVGNNGAAAPFGSRANDASLLAKIEYSADFGTVGVVGEFTQGDNVSGTAEENDGYKAYATLDLSEFIPGGILGGFYMWQDDVNVTNATNARFGGAEDIWGIGFQMNLTDNVEFIAYHNVADNQTLGGIAGRDEDLTTIGLNWYPVSGLKVFAAYSFGDAIQGGAFGIGGGANSVAGDNLDYDQILVGLRRSF